MGVAYLARRVFYGLISLLILSAIIFVCTHLLPGDAASAILGEAATPEALATLRARLGLDQPVLLQFAHWLGGMVTGDFGVSATLNQPAGAIIAGRFFNSLALALGTIIVAAALAIPLGVVAAVKRGSRLDGAILTASYVGISIPDFIIAPVLIILLAMPPLNLFPSSGFVALGISPGDWLAHTILPVIALTFVLTAHLLRQTRSGMLDVLASDYIRTARLKGLPESLVLWRHGLRNGLTTTITVLALDIGYLMGSIVIVEEIFAYPGLGRLIVYAVANRDIPLVQGTALVIGAVYVAANILADFAHALLNPRLAQQ
ncbi:MAG TPA: ABC transporter permease [Alphaproteobacteria bacterium]|nr:ABC transporter permease [Alphaproteobacteria bacterium]